MFLIFINWVMSTHKKTIIILLKQLCGPCQHCRTTLNQVKYKDITVYCILTCNLCLNVVYSKIAFSYTHIMISYMHVWFKFIHNRSKRISKRIINQKNPWNFSWSFFGDIAKTLSDFLGWKHTNQGSWLTSVWF